MIFFYKQWLYSRNGATAIEYALIAGLISLVIAGAVYAFGDTLYDLFYHNLGDALNDPDSSN